MMSDTSNYPQKQWRPRWTMWLLYALIITALVSTTTLSRYMTEVAGTGTATVAAVDMKASTVDFTTDSLKQPGASDALTFNVVNFTDSGGSIRVSDVTQDYTITVTTTGNIPLTFTLTGDNTVSNLGNTAEHLGTIVGNGNNNVWSGGILEHTHKTTHAYTLTATWPNTETAKDPKYADEIDLITVTVNSQQAVN